MNDMSAVIIPKSDQLNAEDFLAGPRTYTIEAVHIQAGTEQPVNIRLAGETRAWRPCKSMSRVLVSAWGPDASAYIGRSVTLYNDPKVKWGGMEVGGIRVSHLSHIERDMLLQLTATKGKRAPHLVKPLVAGQGTGSTGTDAAQKWTDAYIAKLEAIETVEQLVAFELERAAKLVELGEKRPELHERCVTAAQARGASLAQEGPADSQSGEDFTDDEATPAAQLLAEIEACQDAATLSELQQRFADAQPSLKGTEITAIRTKLAERKAELV